MKGYNYIYILLFFIVTSANVFSQERNWENMLNTDVENINPVYMPVVGIGAGYLSFLGDVTNNSKNPTIGNFALKINIHTYLDNPRYYKLNFFFLFTPKTPLTVNQRNYSLPADNYNFESDIRTLGFNVHYDFGHFLNKNSIIRPFLSLGGEILYFNSRTDISGRYFNQTSNQWINNVRYNYWSDGTIRNVAEGSDEPSVIMSRDYNYETELRGNTEFNGQAPKYPQVAFAMPLEVGVDFNVTYRTTVRLSYAYHYTFSDDIDNVTNNTPVYKGKDNKDAFSFTSVGLHFDLFSDPKMLKVRHYMAMLENYDQDLILDEDNDGVLDIADRCLHTPPKLEVDTMGCPADIDGDRVSDYLDKEMNSAPGAIVDRDGVEIPDSKVWANLTQESIPREQVETFLSIMNSIAEGSGRRAGSMPIPEKFKSIDTDGDGYVSFDEVLKTIDSFFDFESELTTQDIYELNDFFFAQ